MPPERLDRPVVERVPSDGEDGLHRQAGFVVTIRHPLRRNVLEDKDQVTDPNPSTPAIGQIDGLGRDLRRETKAIRNDGRGRDHPAAGLSTECLGHCIVVGRYGDAELFVDPALVVQPTANPMEPAATDKDNPTTAEFRTAVKNAIARLLSFKDDQGEPMSFGATGLVAVVPPSLLITASEALNTTLVGGGDTNVLQGAATIISFPHLSATDTWYLLKTNQSVRPFIFQDRMPLEFTAQEQNSDQGFRKEKYLYGLRARYRVTYGYWQYALKLTFA